MHIENVDALTAWLEYTVTPLCDADPQVLSQYILALVKKHETEESLINGCKKNLELFFIEKTSDFVLGLVETITTNSYMSWYESQRHTDEKPVPGEKTSVKAESNDQSQRMVDENWSPAAADARGKSKPVQVKTKSTVNTRTTNMPTESLNSEDEPIGSSVRRSENEQHHGRNYESRFNTGDRFRGRRDRADPHNRSNAWKRPSFPSHSGALGMQHPVDRTRGHQSLEKGAVRNRSPSAFRNQGSGRSSGRGWQSLQPSNVAGRVTPVLTQVPQRRSRVDENTSAADRVGRFRKRSRSAARSSSRSPSARSDSSISSLESFSSRCSASKRIHVERGPIESRSSTPLEENTNSGQTEAYGSVSKESDQSSFRPRCRDYDEMGYCIQGKNCPFDHGTDPVIVESPRLPSLVQYQGVPVGSISGGMSQGHRTVIARPLEPSILPNVSLMPPHFRPPALPPTHFLPRHGLPPPPVPGPSFYQPPMAVSSGQLVGHEDIYLQQPDRYRTEPYDPSAPRAMLPTSLEKSSDGWSSRGMHPTYPPPRNTSGMPPVNRHANLVRVPTQEGLPDDRGQTDPVTSSGVQTGLKRKAAVLDQDNQSDSSFLVPPVKKSAPEHPGVRHGISQVSSTTLEMRKIPRDQNTIANINDHFSKFGIIVNLQVGWDGDSQAALVSFASVAQATAAYKCEQPFLNNRFVKIFWHNPDKQLQQNASQQPSAATSSTANGAYHKHQRQQFPGRHQLQLNNTLKKNTQPNTKPDASGSQPDISKEAAPVFETAQPTPPTNSQYPSQEVSRAEILRKSISKDSIEKAGVLRKQQELEQQSRQLLAKYIEQQKVLFEKLEKDKATMSAEDRTEVVQTIKNLAVKIESINSTISNLAAKTEAPATKANVTARPVIPPPRASLKKVNLRRTTSGGSAKGVAPPVAAASASNLSEHGHARGSVFQNKQNAQKVILDTELELMTCHSETSDAEELRQRVMSLKAEAASLGLLGSGNAHVRGRGRGSSVPGRRWAVPRYRANILTVDRRPKQLLITGFQADEKDELFTHISSFGALESSSIDLSVPSLLVSFQLRITAEKVATEGCNFKNKKLTMVWQKSVLSERNTGTDQPELDVTVKPLAHGDFKSDLSGENVPNHLTIQKSEQEKEPSLESDVKSLQDEKQRNHDSFTEGDEDIELLCLDEEDDEDDEEERPWRR